MLERVTGNFLAQDDDSSVVRKEMVTDGLNAFYRNPLLGDGLGSSRQFGEDGITGPHNMWIVFGIEFGILGVFLLLVSGLLVLSVHNGFANLVGAQYLIASLFSHTLLDDMFTAVLLPMGLVLIPLYSSSNRYRKRRRRQKM
jgi:O-antigen ligase